MDDSGGRVSDAWILPETRQRPPINPLLTPQEASNPEE